MKTKRRLHPLLLVAGMLVIGWIGFRMLLFSGWEAMLAGPFYGTVHHGELTGEPASVLKLSRGAQLEIHEAPGTAAPVLALRRSGQIEWQQLLLPERKTPDGKITMGAIRDARFRSTVFSLTSGTKVRFTCDWNGREGGVIYLRSDQAFDRFGISW